MENDSIKTELNRKGNRRGLHPNSLENLHHPGIGRPPNELSITNLQREMLSEPCPYADEGKTWAQWLARRGMELAGKNPRYYCELMDRLEGKVTQPIDAQVDTDIIFTIGKGYTEQHDKTD